MEYFLVANVDKKEKIDHNALTRAFPALPKDWFNEKITKYSYRTQSFLLDHLLASQWNKQRIVIVGEYCGTKINYKSVKRYKSAPVNVLTPWEHQLREYYKDKVLVNYDKQEVIHLNDFIALHRLFTDPKQIPHLPTLLLLAENRDGIAEYYGTNQSKLGAWAYNRVGITTTNEITENKFRIVPIKELIFKE